MSKKNNHKVINGMYKGQIADIPQLIRQEAPDFSHGDECL